MKPADPLMTTRATIASCSCDVGMRLYQPLCGGGGIPWMFSRAALVQLGEVELWPVCEAVPAEVLGDPLRQFEVRDAGLAVQPDRRQLGHGQPQPARLGRQFQPDLETVPALDPHLLDEGPVVGLEGVGGVP